MKKQILRFSIWQSSKILSILSFVITALVAIPLGIYVLVKDNNQEAAKTFFLQPIVHLIITFISSVIVFFIYNLLAKWLGGVELETVSKGEVPPHE